MSRITLQDLERYLWGSAIILRGTMAAGSYKNYIFPLLFYKRICDVYDEECEIALNESDGDVAYAKFAENHRFQVPENAHWNKIREVSMNIGHAIQKALRDIERANYELLSGVFGDAAWTNKERLPDNILKELIEHFSSQVLSIENCPEDELGNGYEYLIKQFADDSGHTAQEFYTNRTVVHLMTELLKPKPGESIYDPTCGSAGMLISSIAYLKEQNKEWRTVELYGQELNLLTAAIGRMNLFLHGVENFKIVHGDTLKNPYFLDDIGKLRQFDMVLANPPYSIKQWDREAFSSDSYGRNFLGTPPQGRADYAFLQHILSSMKPDTGRCAILFPHGVLFRNEEAVMRKKLVEMDLVECVIGIGQNLFYNSPMEACIVICRNNKPNQRKNKILFINARDEVTKDRSFSYLEDTHIHKISAAYENFVSIQGFAAVVGKEDVLNNNGLLSIPLFVRDATVGLTDEAEQEFEEILNDWLLCRTELHSRLEDLLSSLEGGGNNG
ncbi:class I SAM-dependent DNA methyltransferase [Bacillus sp. EB600]|uniref:type I restriction-modification system subunit M n=1 Tax=Bacillus sp. EB600 TaxID=2806345 RepID=UPI00210DD530|nr:class I SAM-dependent DNA methyltransferase [Bacillus sp. EB600]MCQ6281073.1 SAM-dependent DNA methyltransferase [Bacillus sp. EB600]